MKVWLVALIFLIPLAMSARAFERVTFERHAVEEELAPEAPADDGESRLPIDVATWFAIIVGWVGILVLETRMNQQVKHLHGVIDKLERYVNTRDNLLAVRVDDLDAALRDDADDAPRERPRNQQIDHWRPQRRH